MLRIYTSFAIILSIIIINIASLSMMKNEYDYYENLINNIEMHIENDEKELAMEQALLLNEQWEKSVKKLSFFVTSYTLDEITDNSSKIAPLIKSDSDEVIAETEYLKKRIKRLYTRSMPYIYNIF